MNEDLYKKQFAWLYLYKYRYHLDAWNYAFSPIIHDKYQL